MVLTEFEKQSEPNFRYNAPSWVQLMHSPFSSPYSKTGQTQERKIVNNAPQALIIEPSRELAEQTFNQIRLFKKHLGETIHIYVLESDCYGTVRPW